MSDKLRTVERWRTAELESAQAERVALERVAQQRESARDQVQAKLTDTHSFVRERLAGTEPLSPEMLGRFAAFASLQQAELDAAQAAVETSRASCDAAQEVVVTRFQALSVVQRLSGRRAVEASRGLQRAAQARMDEQALSRLARDNNEEE
jgi:hypothetical protein